MPPPQSVGHLLLEAARRAGDARIQALRESDRSAAEIVRANGLVLGIAMSVLALGRPSAQDTGTIAIGLFGSGVALLAASAVLGARAAVKGEVSFGPVPEGLALGLPADEDVVVASAIRSYARAAGSNARIALTTARRLRGAYGLFALGILAIAAGLAGILLAREV